MFRRNDARYRAFWSIDAAFALVLCVAMFAMLSALLYSAGISAARGADDASGSLLSARFSSYALSQVEGGNGVDLPSVLARTGRAYASLRMESDEGETMSDFAGEMPGEVYCTQRIALREGKMIRLEACIG